MMKIQQSSLAFQHFFNSNIKLMSHYSSFTFDVLIFQKCQIFNLFYFIHWTQLLFLFIYFFSPFHIFYISIVLL